jgi:hypothetical protein
VNKIKISIFTILLVILLGINPSCTLFRSTPRDKTLKSSIIQVRVTDATTGKFTFESLGVVIGDGSQVLTVINYELYSPGDVKVISSAHDEYKATVQAIDSRTGAMLLKLEKGKLPAATTRDATDLKSGDKLIIWGPNQVDSSLESKKVLVKDIPVKSPLGFNVVLTEAVVKDGHFASAQAQGAVVTDENGDVFGLEGIYETRLIGRLGPIEYIPPIISVNNALESLSAEDANQPWANGPLLFCANVIGAKSGNYDGFVTHYIPLAKAISPILGKLGKSLPIDNLPHDFFSYALVNQIVQSQDGCLLTTVFPRPVDLRNSADELLARAKWIGIQWERKDGKPSRIVFGGTAYFVDGSFEINGDLHILEDALVALFNDPLPYGR